MNEITYQPKQIIFQQGNVKYYPYFFKSEESCLLHKKLYKQTKWQHRSINMFGKKIKEPRLTAWCGDKNLSYTYSGIKMVASPWTKELLYIKKKIQKTIEAPINSVLLNYYKDGTDYMGWHSDNEKELGHNPIICSVSFGAEREFKFKSLDNSIMISLKSGSLLVMAGSTQKYWKHSLPKRKRVLKPRINLTFRYIQD